MPHAKILISPPLSPVLSVCGNPVVPQVGPSEPQTVHLLMIPTSGSDQPTRLRDMAGSVRTAGANSMMLDVPAGWCRLLADTLGGWDNPFPINALTLLNGTLCGPFYTTYRLHFLYVSMPAGFHLLVPDLRAPVH